MSTTPTALVALIALPACTILFPFEGSERDAGASGHRDAAVTGRDAAVDLDGEVPGDDSGAGVDAGDTDAGACVAPTIVDREGSSASAVCLVGSFAYVGRWSSGIRVFDVSNPAALRECQNVDLDDLGGSVTSIRSDGADLWVAKKESGVFHLTFPEGNGCDPDWALFSDGNAIDAIPCGELICTAADADGVDVFQRDGTFVDHVGVSDARRLAVAGNHLLVGTDYSGAVVVIDRDTLEPSVTHVGERVADLTVVNDDYVLVATGGDGLTVFDLSTLPSLPFVGGAPTENDAVAIASDGAWAFVGTGSDPAGWIEIFDLADPAAPAPVATVELLEDCQGIELSATHAFVADDTQLVAIDRGCAQ